MNICKSLIIALAAVFAAPSMLAAVDADALAASADREPKNAALNLKAGKALFENGDYIKSKKYLERGGNEALPWLGKIDFIQY